MIRLLRPALARGLFVLLAGLIPAAPALAYSFSDNFEDSNPSHWQQRYNQNTWSIVTDGSKVYKQTNASGRRWSQLHLFERDVADFSGRFKVNSTSSGEIGWMVRVNYINESGGSWDGSWVLLRYNFGSQKYEIYEREETGGTTIQRFATAGTANLPTGQWHEFKISTSGSSVTLQVKLSGQSSFSTVASANNLDHRTYGRLALVTRDTVASFDDIAYSGPEGRVEDGAYSYDMEVDTGLGGSEWAFARHTDGRLIGMRNRFVFYSTDNGQTWSSSITQTPGVGGMTPQILRLDQSSSSKLLGIGNYSDGLHAIVSTDNGATWSKQGLIYGGSFDPGLVMADSLRQVANGDVFVFVNAAGGSHRLYRSTNDGSSWTQVKTWPDSDPNEGKVVDWSGGKLRLLARPRSGAGAADNRLQAAESSDGGSTWGNWFSMQAITTNTTSFNVRVDPSDSDKLFLLWNYNDPAHETNTCGPAAVAPRTRASLARYSKSSGAWSYLMDAEDWEYPSYATSIVQDSRYQNHTLFVDGSFVIAGINRQNGYVQDCSANKDSNRSTYFMRKAKNRLTAYGSFAPIHYARGGIIPGGGGGGGPLFSDDFNDGNANGWTTAGGTWSVVTDGSGVYQQSNNGVNARSTADTSSATACTVSVRLKLTSVGSGAAGAGLTLRTTTGGAFYHVRLRSDNNQLELFRFAGGVWKQLKVTAFTPSLNTWYRLEADIDAATNPTLTAAVYTASGSTPLASITTTDTDAARITGAGLAGLRTFGSAARFDDFVVVP